MIITDTKKTHDLYVIGKLSDYKLFPALFFLLCIGIGYPHIMKAGDRPASNINTRANPLLSDPQITNYNDLRALSGTIGYSLKLTGKGIGGTFFFSPNDPNGNGDDNGIVISAKNGWWERQFANNETEPIEMDWFELADNTEITGLLLKLANAYAPSLYLRAPSSDLTLLCNTIDWQADLKRPVKTFVLLENGESLTHLKIKHVAEPKYKYILWHFSNFETVKIGGNRLSITFQGTHPGLGNGNPEKNQGLLDFIIDDDSTPKLLDIRANVRDAEDYGFHIYGGTDFGSGISRVKQLNLSGLYWNAPVFVHAGVQQLWFDPDHFKVSDPYNRTQGWDGAVAGTYNGRKVGCYKADRRQGRTSGGSFYYVDKAVGGVTLEYGCVPFIPRGVGRIGNSVSDPFIVRFKDWGASGPESLTGYPSGVGIKTSYQPIFFKGDPAETLGNKEPFRFIRFEALPPDYGNGTMEEPICGKCASDNSTDNNYQHKHQNFIRFEANRGDVPKIYVNSYWDIQFSGDIENSFNLDIGSLIELAYEPYDSPGPATPDRSFGHVVRLNAGTKLTQSVNLIDSITVTGEGQWNDLTVKAIPIFRTGKPLLARNNWIKDTNVSGTITIGPDASNTHIENVNFGDSVRTIIDIKENSDLIVTNVCVPKGSIIEGRGKVHLNGKLIKLPYIFEGTENYQVNKAVAGLPQTINNRTDSSKY